MAVSGKIIIGPTARVAISSAGKVKRCGCCENEGSCASVIRMETCYQEVDSNCHNLYPQTIYLCADTRCTGVETATPVYSPTAVVLYNDRCYRSFGTPIPFSKMPEGATLVELPEIDCSPTELQGCDGYPCPGRTYVCPCLCYSLKQVAGSYYIDCCFGRKDENGHLSGADFDYDETFIWYMQKTNVNPGQFSATCIDIDCIESRSCIAYSTHTYTVGTPNPFEGCGIQKEFHKDTLVDRRTTPYPGYFYACCTATDTAPYSEDPEFRVVYLPDVAITVNSTTTTEFLDTTSAGTCTVGYRVTTVDIGDCTYRRTVETNETWGYGTDDGSIDCQCQTYDKTVHTKHYVFRSSADTDLCAQCDGELR